MDNLIPSDDTRQIGRRKEELDFAKDDKREKLYNREPIVASAGSGTKENPIMVPSGLDERTVGFEDPETHAIMWFNIQRGGKLHYIKHLGKYFQMEELEPNPPDPHGH